MTVGGWKARIAFHAIKNYNNRGTPNMTRQRMRKVTYSLPVDLLEGVRSVVEQGAAPSYSAFVQQALAEGVDRAREALLAESFLQASRDPLFLDDVERTLRDYGNDEDTGDRDH
jgi:Arc/MetJ-type ribon-helix-helix transcriptional regulator